MTTNRAIFENSVYCKFFVWINPEIVIRGQSDNPRSRLVLEKQPLLCYTDQMLYATLPCQSPDLDLDAILLEVGARFELDWEGIHGFPHWARVHAEGVRVGRLRGGNLKVIELFAVLHDSCREDENQDPLHGPRAAEYARSLVGNLFQLKAGELDRLCYAIEQHSRGLMSSDPTVQSCWDADRLDLRRLGIVPNPRLLSREALLR